MGTIVSEHPRARPGGDRTGSLRARFGRPWLVELTWLAATMAVGLLAAAWVLRLWDASLHIPIASGGDGLLSLAALKGLIQEGWYFTNSSLGTPLGQQLYDYSAFDADNLQWLMLRILAFGTSDSAALLNVYYVLGYPLVAGAAYGVLRALGISRPTSMVGGVLFTLLPYHFMRGEGHLFLGNYFAVPAGAWLVLRTLLGERLLPPRPGVRGMRGRVGLAPAATVAACVVAGGSTLYYAVFTILLVGSAAVIRLAATRSWRAALPGLGVAAAVAVVLVVNISPALIYQVGHGRDAAIAARQPFESEVYSLSLTQLVIPNPGHRIDALARAGQKHQAVTPVPGEGGAQLGALLALSFLGLLGLLAVRSLRGGVQLDGRGGLAMAAAIASALAFLYGTFGGLSALIAFYISPQIRGWDRLVPFIAFFALVGLALAVDALRERLLVRRGGRLLAPALVAVVGVVGVLDLTSPTPAATYTKTAAGWTSDGRFVSAVEAAAPRDAMILQLPFHAFPEVGPQHQMADYDLFKGYVHSHDLRWSYGAMKGRPQEWTDEAAVQPLSWVIPAAVAAGFSGVYVDRAAYDDQGAATEAQVRRALGDREPTVTSADGRLVYYDAGSLERRLRTVLTPVERRTLADILVHPVRVKFGSGVFPEEGADGQVWRWMATDAVINLENPDDTGRRIVLAATASAGPGVVRIRPPGAPVETIRFTKGPRRLRLSFVAPPGKSALTFHVETPKQGGADARDLRLQLFSLRIADATVRVLPRP